MLILSLIKLLLLQSRNFQKLDTDKLDMLLSCDDIWDEVFFSFDDVSDCLECFNLIMTGLLDLLAPLKKLRVRRQECPWPSNASLSTARHLRDVAKIKSKTLIQHQQV